MSKSRIGVTKLISSIPLVSEIFNIAKKHKLATECRVIFDGFRRSSAAVTPVKYECV